MHHQYRGFGKKCRGLSLVSVIVRATPARIVAYCNPRSNKVTNPRETGDAITSVPESRTVLLSNLVCLAAYLLPPDDTSLSEAALAEIIDEEEHQQEPFKTRTLRRRVIQKIIEIKHEVLMDELQSVRWTHTHGSPSHLALIPPSYQPFEYEYYSSDPRLSLLHRLILVMRLREQYSLRECSLSLRISDTVTEKVFQHAIYSM